jgi:cytosine/creatinine deaminase
VTKGRNLWIRNIRPLGGEITDILILDGEIAETCTDVPETTEVLNGAGAIALPGLINAHCHLDKTRWGLPWEPHAAGPTRDERIAADREMRRGLMASTKERAAALAGHCAALGTSHIRTHVDVEPEFGLLAIEALLELSDEIADRVSIELVAFPQFGLVTNPGTAALMEAAIKLGASLLGGIDPSSIDHDRAGQLDAIFDMAERTGAGIDIHLHETAEEGAASLDMICAHTKALGMAGRVTVSHGFCLGTVDEKRLAGLINAMADAGVGVVSYAPGDSPVPPVKRLVEAGVAVGVGTDGIRDAWTPYGNGDMLERAMMLAYRSGFRRDEDIELALNAVIAGGAALMGLENHGLAPGCAGDMVLVNAETLADAVTARPSRKAVIKGGVNLMAASCL